MSIAKALQDLISAAGGTPSGSQDIETCIREYAELVKSQQKPAEGGS